MRERIALELFGAYCTHTGWKSAVSGQPIPHWEGVAPAIKAAWLATADRAISLGAECFDNESIGIDASTGLQEDDPLQSIPPPPGPIRKPE
jgi:hypothetical protein